MGHTARFGLFAVMILRSLAQEQVTAPEATPPAIPEAVRDTRQESSPSNTSSSPDLSGSDFSSTVFSKAGVTGNESSSNSLSTGEDPENRLLLPFVRHVVVDQKQFWAMPRRFRLKDLEWATPAAGAIAAFVASDSWIEKQIPSRIVSPSQTISNYAVYSLVGLAGSSYLLGLIRSDDHLAETGLLSAEAAINSTAVSYLFKSAFERQRPYQGNEHGTFFRGGSSFPSEHAAVAWSVASVWAHEYPGALSQTFAYGLASAVTLTRVTGKQHFASDVLVGSALGWYFARQAYRSHHDPYSAGALWGDLFDHDSPRENSHDPKNMGSPYIPIDSWVYPAFDRLIALGYIVDAYLGIRPWTRLECARLLEEVEEHSSNLADGGADGEKLLSALEEEFRDERRRLDGERSGVAGVDSVYARTTSISGTPLRDGYHFGQTIVNDYGRPYGQGFSGISGLTAHLQAGPLAVSLEGEYQHAPAVASDPLPVLQATAAVDQTLPLSNAVPQIDRFQILAGMASMTFNGIDVSFGRQSLWLGPGNFGPFLFSNNSAPMDMLRIDSVSPYEVPLLSRVLGPVRSEFFLGRLSGQKWEFSPQLSGPGLASQPFLHGTKFNFHPTENLEFGMGFTAQFGGPGNPFTWGNFVRTFYSHRVSFPADPAKRLSEFDFSYRLPGLRDWAQVYVDSMVIDEYSPLGSTRPAINPGMYFPRLPKVPRMDLRLEGATTDLNVPTHFGPGAFYWDGRYRSGYTNDGNLIGSWVGRRGRAEQGWLTYHFSPHSNLTLSYRHNSVDTAFLEGGTQRDWTLRSAVDLTRQVSLNAALELERWHFPALLAAPQSDLAATVQLTFRSARTAK